MGGELLLDTGALVSLLDRSQTHHRDFADFFAGWRGAVVSTEELETNLVFTTDRRDFNVYRGAGNSTFQILPQEIREPSDR